jgi:hypothetical protein
MKRNQIMTGIAVSTAFLVPAGAWAGTAPGGRLDEPGRVGPRGYVLHQRQHERGDRSPERGDLRVFRNAREWSKKTGHDHAHGTEEGFNLRHLELQFSAAVDPYFKGSAIAAVDLEGAELETAEVETTSSPLGPHGERREVLQQHRVYQPQARPRNGTSRTRPSSTSCLLGEHGLNDKGLQLSWLAPTPFYMLLGAESFQGNNEKMFAYHGDGALPRHEGPRVGHRLAESLPKPAWSPRALQAGLFRREGRSSGGARPVYKRWTPDPDEADQWLFYDGYNAFHGADLIYKFNSPKTVRPRATFSSRVNT